MNVRIEENLRGDGVVISVGISDFIPGQDRALHPVFERADALMYQRKQQLKAMGARIR